MVQLEPGVGPFTYKISDRLSPVGGDLSLKNLPCGDPPCSIVVHSSHGKASHKLGKSWGICSRPGPATEIPYIPSVVLVPDGPVPLFPLPGSEDSQRPEACVYGGEVIYKK